mmetsp:Transcript_2665/g.4482  ORF Transcript_2665/g.4482 Transcript_2665/m.4482 type:complete len:144 (+) Transcript_2665:284-715(+)
MSADGNSNENHKDNDQSWLEDRLSQDNMSNNNLRDSGQNNVGGANGHAGRGKNGKGSVNSLNNQQKSVNGNSDIIPERRRKYLNNTSEDTSNIQLVGGPSVQSVGQQMMGVENHELVNDQAKANIHKKNNKNNVHLQPLEHNP